MADPRNPVWMVPRRQDPHFVGREAELPALEAALAATGSSALTQPATVHGLGGVGKTVLAVEFACRHAAYAAVLWLAAENPTTLAAAFGDLSRELGLPEAGDPDQNKRTAAVLRWLASPASGHWLLVFDNAERREDVEPFVPRRHAGHVLITSRNPEWAPLAKAVPVRPLPPSRSIELLRQGLQGGSHTEADRLAAALGADAPGYSLPPLRGSKTRGLTPRTHPKVTASYWFVCHTGTNAGSQERLWEEGGASCAALPHQGAGSATPANFSLTIGKERPGTKGRGLGTLSRMRWGLK